MDDDRRNDDAFLMCATTEREAEYLTILADRLCRAGTVRVQTLMGRDRLGRAIRAYADMRASGADVTVIGWGGGCAAALTLAGTYPVERAVLIAPRLDARGALTATAQRRLFAVVAPTYVLCPERATARARRDAQTILGGVSARTREWIPLATASDAEDGALSETVDEVVRVMTHYRLFYDTICV